MAGSDANSVNARRESVAIDCDFSPCNLMEEIDGDGWLRTTKPEGGGDLPKLHTPGGRGMELRDLRSKYRVE